MWNILLFLAPNTGLYLRLQQIWAVFVKKFYISLRAYGFLSFQIFFPVFFIIFANVLAISLDNKEPEPKRALTLENSALFVDNMTLFYAQLGNISTDNASEPFFLSVSQYKVSGIQFLLYYSHWQELTPSEFGARNMFNFTEATQLIREEVDSQNFTLDDCCNYHFQILDQYCASRSVVSNVIHYSH